MEAFERGVKGKMKWLFYSPQKDLGKTGIWFDIQHRFENQNLQETIVHCQSYDTLRKRFQESGQDQHLR